MANRRNNTIGLFIAIGIAVFAVGGDFIQEYNPFAGPPEPVEPNWTAITAWPGAEAAEVEAQPDPNRVFTAIVLDDSGSMGSDMEPAKAAVLASLGSMDPQDRVSVIALNDGVILPFMAVEDALKELPVPLGRVRSDGSTPLTRAMQIAQDALASEAARSGAFGTYRILVTTDGAADDRGALTAEIETIARETPIQVATIGVGVNDRHVLARPDLASFVTISDISGLASALQSAIAEEQSFSAITNFEGN